MLKTITTLSNTLEVFKMSIYPNFPCATELPLHCNHNDRKVVGHLIRQLLFAGCTIAIHDGEELCIQNSTDLNEILYEMSSTGEDFIIASNNKGKRMGWFHLIYHNGSDDDAMVCISDYLANQFCEQIYSEVNSAVVKHDTL